MVLFYQIVDEFWSDLQFNHNQWCVKLFPETQYVLCPGKQNHCKSRSHSQSPLTSPLHSLHDPMGFTAGWGVASVRECECIGEHYGTHTLTLPTHMSHPRYLHYCSPQCLYAEGTRAPSDLLLTGSSDKIIRLWVPTTTSSMAYDYEFTLYERMDLRDYARESFQATEVPLQITLSQEQQLTTRTTRI